MKKADVNIIDREKRAPQRTGDSILLNKTITIGTNATTITIKSVKSANTSLLYVFIY